MSLQIKKIKRYVITSVPGHFLHSQLQAIGRSYRHRHFPFTSVFKKRWRNVSRPMPYPNWEKCKAGTLTRNRSTSSRSFA